MKICIISHLGYGALTGGDSGHIGGVERQTSLTARWLARRGHDVSFICWNEGGPDEEIVDGVHVIKLCKITDGMPILRFFNPRWTSLIRALTLADADMYYQNCGEYVTGQIAYWCKTKGRKFIFSIASNMEVEKNNRALGSFRARQMFYYGLRHADAIITQTQFQTEALMNNFGLRSTALPMPCPALSTGDSVASWRGEKKEILWAARIAPIKRLEMLLDIAQAMDDVHFNVCGSPYADNAYTRDLLERMRRIPNVTYHGAVERPELSIHFLSNVMFCCTSSNEGFPNTFLEAWSCGLPVVSTFDPDNIITRCDVGLFAESADGIRHHIRRLLDDGEMWHKFSKNARQHYVRNYDVDAAMTRFEQFFRNVTTATL